MNATIRTTPASVRRRLLAQPIVAQGCRFVLAGGFVALVYVATTTLLHLAGVAFEVALAIGFCTALATHFTLQRRFVWKHASGFALPVRGQAIRYLALAGIQYGVTAGVTATVPGAIGVSTEIVYLVVAAAISITNFLLFRGRVFHAADHGVSPPRMPEQ
jgi:putative flippase GtrA